MKREKKLISEIDEYVKSLKEKGLHLPIMDMQDGVNLILKIQKHILRRMEEKK